MTLTSPLRVSALPDHYMDSDGTGVIPDVGSIFLQCVQICISLCQDTWYNTMDNISLNQCKGHGGPHFSIANHWKIAANNII